LVLQRCSVHVVGLGFVRFDLLESIEVFGLMVLYDGFEDVIAVDVVHRYKAVLGSEAAVQRKVVNILEARVQEQFDMMSEAFLAHTVRLHQ